MGQPTTCERGILPSRRQTRGTETSQYPEEEKTIVIAQVVASERARAQTGTVTAVAGVVGPSTKIPQEVRETGWKAGPQKVKALYLKTESGSRRHLSSAEHEKFCMNPRGPSRKAKYYRETDSEPVP